MNLFHLGLCGNFVTFVVKICYICGNFFSYVVGLFTFVVDIYIYVAFFHVYVEGFTFVGIFTFDGLTDVQTVGLHTVV